jgi:hypothetical protein
MKPRYSFVDGLGTAAIAVGAVFVMAVIAFLVAYSLATSWYVLFF